MKSRSGRTLQYLKICDRVCLKICRRNLKPQMLGQTISSLSSPSAGWQLWVMLDFKVTAFEFSHWPAGDRPGTEATQGQQHIHWACGTFKFIVPTAHSLGPHHIGRARCISAWPATSWPPQGPQHICCGPAAAGPGLGVFQSESSQ